jgi:prepilin-type N-terminal cleavage/methylation domain-containing protein
MIVPRRKFVSPPFRAVKNPLGGSPVPQVDARLGFTMIELLVVIGIIAVLIALIIPAVSAAKNTSRTTQCCSNQRQLMEAFLVYCTQSTYGRVPVYTGNYDAYWADDMKWIIDPSNPNYRLCPATTPNMATFNNGGFGGGVYTQYWAQDPNTGHFTAPGSYGFNLAVDSAATSVCAVDPATMVRTLSQSQPVVVIADCVWTGFKGDSVTQSPQNQLIQPPSDAVAANEKSPYTTYSDGTGGGIWEQWIGRCFIDRHQGRIVVGMSDGSAMPIKLRDLWGGVRMNAKGVDRRSQVSFPVGY